MSLKCIPHNHPSHTCTQPARWYVWYESSGGLYTYYCNLHLALALLNLGDEQITQIDRIRG